MSSLYITLYMLKETMTERIFIRKIRPSIEETKAIVQLQLETFLNTSLHLACFPKGKETWSEERVYREGQIVRRLNNPTMHWLVALLETSLPDGTTQEEIIGYSLWESPSSASNETNEEERATARAKDLSYRPDSMDKQAHEKITADMAVVFKHLLGEEPNSYWCELFLNCSRSAPTKGCESPVLQSLAVLPRHQRKGAATKMVRWGIDEAASDGKGVVLLSSPFARPFYIAIGFVTEVEMHIRNEAYAGMKMRPPTSSVTTL